MEWLSGILLIVVVAVVLVRRRKPLPEAEGLVTDKDDLAALMQGDLERLSTHAAEAADGSGEMSQQQTQDMMTALHADAPAAYEDTSPPNAPILYHDANTAELVLLWDDADGAEPAVTVSPDPETPEMTDIFMNGDLVARVSCARRVDAAEVSLMPQSLAASLGLSAQPG